jgi:hypothetical protein
MDVQPVGGGMYVMDGKSYDLSTLVLAVSLERADAIEKQLVDQINVMKKRNDVLNGLTKALAALRGKDKQAPFDANTFDTGVPKPDGTGTYNLKELMESEGMALKSEKGNWFWTPPQCEEAIEVLKAKTDSLNSDSQVDMIRTQSLVNKRDQAFEMASNLISKDQKSKDAIVGNLR